MGAAGLVESAGGVRHTGPHALAALTTPFVFRRYLDFDAVAGMRELHAQLRAEKNDANKHQSSAVAVSASWSLGRSCASLFVGTRSGPAYQTDGARTDGSGRYRQHTGSQAETWPSITRCCVVSNMSCSIAMISRRKCCRVTLASARNCDCPWF